MQFVTTILHNCRRKYYYATNKILPFKKIRWTLAIALISLYFYRSYGLQYNVVTYLIFFYILQLLTDYLTPRGLADVDDDEPLQIPEIEAMLADQLQLINGDISEKPLVSELNEYGMWERVVVSFLVGLLCTLFEAIQIDVFWPLLMVYFIVLVVYTVHKIVKKMKRYRYSISDFNKKPDLV